MRAEHAAALTNFLLILVIAMGSPRSWCCSLIAAPRPEPRPASVFLDQPLGLMPEACDNLVSMTSTGKTSSAAGRHHTSYRARPGRWQLQEAKARFSEVVGLAKHEGPQHVTVHGREEVVVVGADDFRRLAGDRTGQALVDAMQLSPHRSTSIQPPRRRMPVRDVDL